MKRFIFFLLAMSNIVYASIETSIEPKIIHLGDSFRLNITLIDEKAETPPNIIPLQNDFTIDGTEHRVSYTIINGDTHNFSQWTILLTPKRAGTLTIPSIRIGQIQTQQSQIKIEGETKKSAAYMHTLIDTPIQINTKTQDKNPYINQQILYSVKLYTRVPLLNASYEPPHLDEALMISLGNREYQTLQNGQTYTVEEQRYAFFPQKSGQQTIEPPSFKALIYGAPPEKAAVAGTPADLNVKPMQTTYTGNRWLPAKSITLSETYDNSAITHSVGHTLTRTITLQGIAIPAELLTLDSIKSTREYSVYPEKPILKNTIHGEDVMGTTTLKLSYLFNTSGTVTLPGFSIHWFNTRTQKEEKAEIPPHIMTIKEKKGHIKPLHIQAKHAPTPISYYPYIIILLSLLLLGLFFAYLIQRIRTSQKPFKTLKKACKDNNALSCEHALLMWARAQWPNDMFLNLNDVQKKLRDKAFIEAITQLSAALYGKTTTLWAGDTLLTCLTHYKKTHPVVQKINHRLPEINSPYRGLGPP